MLEIAILLLACLNPEPALPVTEVESALSMHYWTGAVRTGPGWEYVYGAGRPELPVEPVAATGDPVTYKVWVDPLYDRECFEDEVDAILSDPRSWPHVRKASEGETPQFWVALTAPAAACGTHENRAASCSWNNGDGTGLITINVYRWNRGFGFDLSEDRALVINHEVGHMLGFGHYDDSLMGTTVWHPASGSPDWGTADWMNQTMTGWPSEAERDVSLIVYTERWLWDTQGPWDGEDFVTNYGLNREHQPPEPISPTG